MRPVLNEDQLRVAIEGMSLGERSRSIADEYFVKGATKSDTARRYELSPAYVSKLVAKIESNFQRNLRARGQMLGIEIKPEVND